YYPPNLYVYRRQNNSLTMLGSVNVGDQSSSGTHHIQVRTDGPSIKVSWDWVQLLSVTDTFNATAPRHGLAWIWDNVSTFDNFRVDRKPTVQMVINGSSQPDITVPPGTS